VVLPGVQVTFAFLLTVTFMDRFAEATALQRSVYFAALLSTALATAFFIAPTIQHRILWRQGERATRLKIGNGLLIAGTVLLAIGMSCVIFLVADVVYGRTGAIVATTTMVVVPVAHLPAYEKLSRLFEPRCTSLALSNSVSKKGLVGDLVDRANATP
jgi:drug/metabolite transporter (DMT)-like permease